MSQVRMLILRRLAYPAALAAGLLALGGMLALDVASRLTDSGPWPVHSATGVRMTPLTSTGTSMDGFAGWSPDGRRVIFMRDGQIWSALPQERRLTGRPGTWDSVPRWVPGTDRIVFIRTDLENGRARLILKALDSGRERELATEPEQIGYLAVSPDGRDVVYTTKNRIVKVEGMSRPRTILAAGGQIDMVPGGVTYSPDGRTLVFGFGERGKLNLYRMGASGGKMTPLTKEGGIMPAFAPDGGKVAYRRPSGQSGIWLLDLPTGKTELIAPDTRTALLFHPTFTPDGKALLLSRLNIKREGRPTSDIVSLSLHEGGGR